MSDLDAFMSDFENLSRNRIGEMAKRRKPQCEAVANDGMRCAFSAAHMRDGHRVCKVHLKREFIQAWVTK